MLLRQREDAEDATDARFTFVPMNVIADGAGGCPECGYDVSPRIASRMSTRTRPAAGTLSAAMNSQMSRMS